MKKKKKRNRVDARKAEGRTREGPPFFSPFVVFFCFVSSREHHKIRNSLRWRTLLASSSTIARATTWLRATESGTTFGTRCPTASAMGTGKGSGRTGLLTMAGMTLRAYWYSRGPSSNKEV